VGGNSLGSVSEQQAVATAITERIESKIGKTPAARLLGRRLVCFDPETGVAEVSFEADERFLNSAGMIQGGFVTAMLDETVGPALIATLSDEEWAPTTNIQAQFLAPIFPGPVTGRGRVVKRGRTIAYLAGELFRSDGRLAATATTTVNIRRDDPPA
jgi:uncharacterized protein (TIGR00369 family)